MGFRGRRFQSWIEYSLLFQGCHSVMGQKVLLQVLKSGSIQYCRHINLWGGVPMPSSYYLSVKDWQVIVYKLERKENNSRNRENKFQGHRDIEENTTLKSSGGRNKWVFKNYKKKKNTQWSLLNSNSALSWAICSILPKW